jgi:hypothetical protein
MLIATSIQLAPHSLQIMPVIVKYMNSDYFKANMLLVDATLLDHSMGCRFPFGVDPNTCTYNVKGIPAANHFQQ